MGRFASTVGTALGKRLLVILGLGSILLVACGGAAEPGGDNSAAAGDAAEAASTGWESHDDLEAAAAEESGTLKVYTSTQPETIEVIRDSFLEKYPDVDIEITEQSGSDAQRILLEVQGEANDYDVLYLSQEVYRDFLPHLEQIDLLEMAESDVIDMPTEVINPDEPYTMAAGTGLAGVAYNPESLPEELIPKTWDDYLKPELQGRKFLADIEPVNLATLVPAWGEEAMREYAAKIGAQEPVWARGETTALTAMAAGEYQLHFASNYHSAFRAMGQSSDTVAITLIEPIPVRFTQTQGIQKGTDNLASSVLFLEHMLAQEVQTAMDELEPRQSSIYLEGAELAKLTEGKELSVWSWEYFPKMADYLDVILEEWGFPTAEVQEEE